MKAFVLLFVLVAPTGQYKEAMMYQPSLEQCMASLESQKAELIAGLPEGYKYILECVEIKKPADKF